MESESVFTTDTTSDIVVHGMLRSSAHVYVDAEVEAESDERDARTTGSAYGSHSSWIE